MPIYEFRCTSCGGREEVFTRTVSQDLVAPACANAACKSRGQAMVRAVTAFVRHMTESDKMAEAEAKWGKEVDAAMGPEPDVGKYARRFDTVGKDLPPE